MLRWCLNVFEKIVVKHLHKSLKIHTSRRRRLKESIRRKKSQFRQSDDWYLLHDNAPAHCSQLVKEFLAKTRNNGLPYPPYSPDLTPCDFHLLPSMQKHLQGRCFESSDEMKGASQEDLRRL
ncbi:putative mariner transposase [Trichonephila clavipes]|nr:putative mariner transposase [Trichonephila clavipes]